MLESSENTLLCSTLHIGGIEEESKVAKSPKPNASRKMGQVLADAIEEEKCKECTSDVRHVKESVALDAAAEST